MFELWFWWTKCCDSFRKSEKLLIYANIVVYRTSKRNEHGNCYSKNYGVNIQITYISAFQVPQKAEI
jgi:hypothetical protein